MTFLLATLCDTAAVYGPCAATFGMEPWHPAVSDALEVLQGKKQALGSYGMWEKEGLEDALAPYQCTEPLALKAWRPAGTNGKDRRSIDAGTSYWRVYGLSGYAFGDKV